VVEPKIFLEVISTLRKYGVKFRVPNDLNDVCFNGEVLIVDDEGLNLTRELKQVKEVCGGILKVREPREVGTTVMNAILGESNLISIGIDVGKRIAYAVLAGGKLVTYGYVDSVSDVNELLDSLGGSSSRTVLLGIGAEHVEHVLEDLSTILSNEVVTAAYIVEEKNTNKAMTPELIGADTENLTKDFRAAISIAMKAYERYLSAKI
jgi:hypothetical protein